MDKQAMALLRRLCEREIGRPLEQCRPVPVSGWETVRALWPLNAVLHPRYARLRSVRYDVAFAAEADAAIERLADGVPAAAAWADLSPGAWRVLLERQQQALTLAAANEAAGNPPMVMPEGLPAGARTAYAALFLLWSMKLPFPPADRSTRDLPEGDPPASMRQH